jgi:hypothetical protein
MFNWFKREKAPNGERLIKAPQPATEENTDRLDFFKDRLCGLSIAGTEFRGINERLVSFWMRQLVEYRTGKPLSTTGESDTPETLDYAVKNLVGFTYATLSTDIPSAEQIIQWLRELKTWHAYTHQQALIESMSAYSPSSSPGNTPAVDGNLGDVTGRLAARRAQESANAASPDAPVSAPSSSTPRP